MTSGLTAPRSSPLDRTSIIVPVGQGEVAWRSLLADLSTLPPAAEIILVAIDGPPGDWSSWTDRANCVLRWIEAPRGRARQMNRGVDEATGDCFWFLHADSRVDQAALAAYETTVCPESDVLYYFDLGFEGDGPSLTRLNAWGANLRSRWLGLPFGDQGFCVSRATCERLGPYDVDADYGEDHLWIWRARRHGVALKRVPAFIRTSSRKYAAKGWLATTGLHLWRTARQAASEWCKKREPSRR